LLDRPERRGAARVEHCHEQFPRLGVEQLDICLSTPSPKTVQQTVAEQRRRGRQPRRDGIVLQVGRTRAGHDLGPTLGDKLSRGCPVEDPRQLRQVVHRTGHRGNLERLPVELLDNRPLLLGVHEIAQRGLEQALNPLERRRNFRNGVDSMSADGSRSPDP